MAPVTVRRYSMILPGSTFSGYVAVQVPENARQDLRPTTRSGGCSPRRATRKEVPVEEQLGLMPFKVGELSAFKNGPHAGALGAAPSCLADGDAQGGAGFEAAPFMVIGVMGSAPDAAGRSRQASPSRPPPRSPGSATPESRCPNPSASTARRAMRPASRPSAARTIRPSPSCNGCGSAGISALRIIGSAPRERMGESVSAFPRRTQRH